MNGVTVATTICRTESTTRLVFDEHARGDWGGPMGGPRIPIHGYILIKDGRVDIINERISAVAAYITGKNRLQRDLSRVTFSIKKHLKNVGPIHHCEPPARPFSRCR